MRLIAIASVVNGKVMANFRCAEKGYRWKRLYFGDKPAPDIAAGAIITLAKVSQEQYPEAAKELRTHVYVDDIGGSRENEDKSKQITSEIDTILSKGQFQIKQWHSNKRTLIRQMKNM